VKRNLKRNILIRKGVPYREYRITFPPLEDAVLRRVTLHTVHDIRPFTTPGFTIAEHSALYLTPTADGGLDVVVETGPDYPAGDKKKDRGKFWTAYGEMIYGTLHSRVGSASAGLSQALLAPSRRGRRVWLTDKFQPRRTLAMARTDNPRSWETRSLLASGCGHAVLGGTPADIR
jgi:hypothetical protein